MSAPVREFRATSMPRIVLLRMSTPRTSLLRRSSVRSESLRTSMGRTPPLRMSSVRIVSFLISRVSIDPVANAQETPPSARKSAVQAIAVAGEGRRAMIRFTRFGLPLVARLVPILGPKHGRARIGAHPRPAV